ncbi:hypothetical protein Pfo_023612 [Paulownia fortunei]|nr:hypothetical protein Pfo_023612 [Paulownia fortunei]
MNPDSITGQGPSIPVINFSSPRSMLVNQIRDSASALGFFQIVNNGVPLNIIKHLLNSIHSFNELPEKENMRFYSRDMIHGAAFSYNFDTNQRLPAGATSCCWARLLDRRTGTTYRTLARRQSWNGIGKCSSGLTSHTDPGVLTVLVQNDVPGLQMKVGEEWANVEPVEGALVINIGDILQIMSNDEYKSVEHKVVANLFQDPHVSVAVFFNPSLQKHLFGPLTVLVSPEKPEHYRQFTLKDYMKRFFSKELDGKTLTNYYRI